MKKIALILLLVTSLYSDAKIYLGFSGGGFNEEFHGINANSSSQMATLRLAYGDIKAYAVEFSLDYQKSDAQVFSSKSIDGDKIGFNINLMKSFDFDIYILPFVKVGFGTGYLDIQRALQDRISYGSFQGSIGTFLPINEHFDIEVGYELRNTTYEPIDSVTKLTAYKSTTNLAYVGINYRF